MPDPLESSREASSDLPVHSAGSGLTRRYMERASERSSLLCHCSDIASNRIGLNASIGGHISLCFSSAREFISANQGLLLVVASQLFFAFMNLGVKFLAGLAQPVPTFEVRFVCHSTRREYTSLTSHYFLLAHRDTHGELEPSVYFHLGV